MGLVINFYNPITQEVEAEGLSQVRSQPGLRDPCGREWKDCKVQRKFSVRLYLRNIRSYINKVSQAWLPNRGQNNDDTSSLAHRGGEVHKAATLDRNYNQPKLQATKKW